MRVRSLLLLRPTVSPTGCLGIVWLLRLLVLLSTAVDGGMVIVVAGGSVAPV